MKKIFFNLLIIIGLSSCQKEKITVSADASDTFFLQSNGSSMPVHVHGNTASKTFMIVVHGGPGGDASIYRDKPIKALLEPKFGVVYWDQRNSGGSQGGIQQKVFLKDVVPDLEKLIVLLKHRYGADISIFLNGHSWGGYLTPAFLVKGDNQKNIKGWIQTCGAHNYPLLNEFAVPKFKDKAAVEIAANRNVAKWTEIRDFCNTLTLPLDVPTSKKLNGFSVTAETLSPEINQGENEQFLSQYWRNNAPLTWAGIGAKKQFEYTFVRPINSGNKLTERIVQN